MLMKCTEGSSYAPKFDLELVGEDDPYLVIEIPLPTRLPPKYEGADIFFVTLRDILKEFISQYESDDDALRVSGILRQYAVKIEQDVRELPF